MTGKLKSIHQQFLHILLFSILFLVSGRHVAGICAANEPDQNKSAGMKNNIKSVDQLDKRMNFIQADLMLDLLQNISEGKNCDKLIDSIMNAEGTELIIRQMNIVRKVSQVQYKQILTSLKNNQAPDIKPMDSSERAKRGVAGLINNVRPALRWALENINILRERVYALKSLPVYEKSKDLALKFLPEKVEISPAFFAVIGGRAGAAALDRDRVYFDVLVMSFSAFRGRRAYLRDSEIIEFFAHEIHHKGYGRISKNRRETLILEKNEDRVYQILSSLISEGSATYLINEHRDINKLKIKRGYKNYLKNPDLLLEKCEDLIEKVLAGRFPDLDSFDKANTFMTGNGYHSAGSLILSVIDKAGGLESVMKTISDPLTLLSLYNDSARSLKLKGEEVYLFDPVIIEKILSLSK